MNFLERIVQIIGAVVDVEDFPATVCQKSYDALLVEEVV